MKKHKKYISLINRKLFYLSVLIILIVISGLWQWQQFAKELNVSIKSNKNKALPQSPATTAGSLDTTFDTRIGANGGVNVVKMYPNGRVLIGGSFNTYDETPRRFVARLLGTGGLDDTFTPATDTDGFVFDADLHSNGKIVIVGEFGLYDGVSGNGIAQLNSNGSLDTSFATGTGAGPLYSVAVQPDGKVIIGGGFVEYNGTAVNRIARLNADGSYDTGFNVGSGASDQVSAIAVQSDGKILIGGRFIGYNFQPANRIARINTDGSVDSTFNSGLGANDEIRDIDIQPNGKIIIGGVFTSYDGTAVNRVARLNTDGSLDSTFSTGTGATPNAVQAVAAQGNGSIIIGGGFDFYDGVERNGIARIKIDGTLDNSFNPGDGLRFGGVNSIDVQSGSNIVIGGGFNDYDGMKAGNVARVLGASAFGKFNNDFDGDGRADISVFRPDEGVWYLSQSTDGFAALKWGISTDELVPADYSGDGKTDLAVFRANNDSNQPDFYILNTDDFTFSGVSWGITGDIPTVADYDSDGKADIAIYRPSNNTWYILNSSDNSVFLHTFGQANDKPFVGDFDGDGKADLNVLRNGVDWFISESSLNYPVPQEIKFGLTSDIPVPSDFDGDGKDNIAVFRPSNGTWYYLQDDINTAFIPFGANGDIPVIGDYDGDGKTDFAVWRPTDRVWYIFKSSDNSFHFEQFGLSTDVPIQ